MTRLPGWLPTWRAFAILFLVVLALVQGFTMSENVRKPYTTEPTLDGRRHGYTPAEAITSMQKYGPDGRPLYLLQETTLDVLFPAAYALWFAAAIGLGLRGLGARGWPWVVTALPFVGAAFDYLENACVIDLLVFVPQLPVSVAPGGGLLAVAHVASFATLAKWRIADASFVLGALGLLIAIIAFLKGRLRHA